jgi:transposase InsO family protein
MAVFKSCIKMHGRPKEVYTDRASNFCDNIPKGAERKKAITQWERAMNELDIKHIIAHSPQGKGRVERCFRTLQDRLVKRLSFEGIKTLAGTNAFLKATFIPQHNEQFAKAPKYPVAVHRPEDGYNLGAVFSLQMPHHMNNDHTFKHDRWRYLVEVDRPGESLAQKTVIVEFRLNGRLMARYCGNYYMVHMIME